MRKLRSGLALLIALATVVLAEYNKISFINNFADSPVFLFNLSTTFIDASSRRDTVEIKPKSKVTVTGSEGSIYYAWAKGQVYQVSRFTCLIPFLVFIFHFYYRSSPNQIETSILLVMTLRRDRNCILSLLVWRETIFE